MIVLSENDLIRLIRVKQMAFSNDEDIAEFIKLEIGDSLQMALLSAISIHTQMDT